MTARDELNRILERQRAIGSALRGDPAWEILLDLADAGQLKTSAVGGTTRVSQTTALRYLGVLEGQGLIEREGGYADGRLNIVRLTTKGLETVERCLA